MVLRLWGVLWATVLSGSPHLYAATAQVALATNFRATYDVLAKQFETDTRHHLTAAVGSTGKLYGQIVHGAPFDLFLSADQTRPALLVERGLGRDSFTYASGQLVLAGASGPQLLTSGTFKRLAIANPKLAPYGRAAMETLTHLNVAGKTRPKLVFAENVGQAVAMYATGNADLALIARGQLQQLPPPKQQGWPVPNSYHQPVHQDALLLKRGYDNPAAVAFISYLKSDTAIRIIRQYGYLVRD